LADQHQQISVPIVVPAAAHRVRRVWTVLFTFYRRVRDRDHLANLDLDGRNDLRQDRVGEETRKRFWQD